MKIQVQAAFSLIELLTTISVLAILVSIAAPSMSEWVQRERNNSHMNELLSGVRFARASAITRNGTVSVCAGVVVCADKSDWKSNVMVFADGNNNGEMDEGDELLRMFSISDLYHWDWSNFRGKAYLSFKPNGMTHSMNGTFTLCDGSKEVSRAVINTAGRLRVESTAAANPC
nr:MULTISPECIES: GspH/FimT family pseudopilin [Pseudomonas]